MGHIKELFKTDECGDYTSILCFEEFNYLRSFTKELFTSFEEKEYWYVGADNKHQYGDKLPERMRSKSRSSFRTRFMRTDKNSEPDPTYIKQKLTAILEKNPDQQIYITQGLSYVMPMEK